MLNQHCSVFCSKSFRCSMFLLSSLYYKPSLKREKNFQRMTPLSFSCLHLTTCTYLHKLEDTFEIWCWNEIISFYGSCSACWWGWQNVTGFFSWDNFRRCTSTDITLVSLPAIITDTNAWNTYNRMKSTLVNKSDRRDKCDQNGNKKEKHEKIFLISNYLIKLMWSK